MRARTQRLRAEFRRLVNATRDRLAAIYSSEASDSRKRSEKAAAFAAMRAEYERLKAESKDAPVFDRWFAAGANNAGIVAVGLYADLVPQFMALIQAEGGDLRRFYVRVGALAALPKADRDAALREERRQESSRADRIAPPHLP